MPAARRQFTLSRRDLQNGTILAVTQAAKLVNIPIAQDVVCHVRKMATALKPSVLQAPKDNDTSARELAKCVKQLVDALDRASEYIDKTGFLEMDGSDEVLGHLVELDKLRDHLSQVHSELQAIQDVQYSTKLASQSQIRNRILELKEELWQNNIQISAYTHAILMHVYYATAQAQRDTRHDLGQRIRTLDRDCRSLAVQVKAVHAMRKNFELRNGLGDGLRVAQGVTLADPIPWTGPIG
ncbi:hypothetical protein FRC11_010990 [Ceratobasidium sp. 423]|nr:hypothetical protein FRC11_010990 [Ceratobasidium sp. 423]